MNKDECVIINKSKLLKRIEELEKDSIHSEWQLYKRGIGSTGKPANISCNAANELGEIYIQYFNQFEEKNFEDYYIDVNQYIYKTYRVISKIEKTTKTFYYPTGKTYTNSRGTVFPVYKNSNGILYIPHRNKRTGKIYWTKLLK